MANFGTKSPHLEEDLKALQFLPDVLDCILNSSKKILDDTLQEKLLSWVAKLASIQDTVTLENLLSERTNAIGFLRKLSLQGCIFNAAAMVFALNLTSVLLNSLTKLSLKIDIGGPGIYQAENYQEMISDIAEQLLISAHRFPYWQEPSVRQPWFIVAKDLIRCTKILQSLDLFDVALQSVEDSCIFVVSAAQDCLVDLIATWYKCISRKKVSLVGLPLHDDEEITHCIDGVRESGYGLGSQQNLTDRCQSIDILTPKDEIFLDSAKEKKNCGCHNHLETCLQKLLIILKQDMAKKDNLKIVTFGVLVRLVKSWPVIGPVILSEISIVSVTSDLLKSCSQMSSDMCSTIVELLTVFLQTSEKNILQFWKSGIKKLPNELMKIHQFSAAIQLSCNIIIAWKHLKGKSCHLLLDCDEEILECTSLLNIVMLPIDCIIHQVNASSSNFCTNLNVKEQLINEMVSKRCKCLALLCHSLTSLEKIVKRDLYLFLRKQTCLVEYLTSILSLTHGQTSESVNCASPTFHLQGSSKVTKAILQLWSTIFAESQKCNLKLNKSEARHLLVQLTAILDNPQSDCSVISKCFETLHCLITAYFAVIGGEDEIAHLGKTVIKRSYDPRWEVRDSLVCFLQKLLHSPTDDLGSWFRRHSMHLRIFECIEDGECFVKASAIGTLVYVSMQEDLWNDLLYQTTKNELTCVSELVNDKSVNGCGFARRALVCAFSKWLTVFNWLQADLPTSQEQEVKDATRQCDGFFKPGERGTLTEVSQIRSFISEAMFDLDWEVKLAALEFWETIFSMHAPYRNNINNYHANKQQQCALFETGKEEESIPFLSCNTLVEMFMRLLVEEELVSKLILVLDDEDRLVALKACRMLCTINSLLPQSEAESLKYVEEDSKKNQYTLRTYAKLKAISLDVVLKEMIAVDCHEEHPLSLIQDILACEKGDSILDCY